ncbi:hypothetical protein EMCRGX_G014653 [Ephydatia muelleri]
MQELQAGNSLRLSSSSSELAYIMELCRYMQISLASKHEKTHVARTEFESGIIPSYQKSFPTLNLMHLLKTVNENAVNSTSKLSPTK